jgi:hypothetical protein
MNGGVRNLFHEGQACSSPEYDALLTGGGACGGASALSAKLSSSLESGAMLGGMLSFCCQGARSRISLRSLVNPEAVEINKQPLPPLA